MTFLSDIEKLVSTIKNIKASVKDAAIKSTERAGKRGVQLASKTDLFKMGKLKNAIVFEPLPVFATGRVIAKRFYAYYLEEGNNQRGPYIYPIHAKVLHFVIAGEDIFAKRVRSHGPLPFMKPARDKLETELPGIIEKNLEQKLRKYR